MEPFGGHPFSDPSQHHEYGAPPPVFVNPHDYAHEHEWFGANDALERQIREDRQGVTSRVPPGRGPFIDPTLRGPVITTTPEGIRIAQAFEKLDTDPASPEHRCWVANMINDMSAAMVKQHAAKVSELLDRLGDRSDFDERMQWNLHVVGVRVGREKPQPSPRTVRPARQPSGPTSRSWWWPFGRA